MSDREDIKQGRHEDATESVSTDPARNSDLPVSVEPSASPHLNSAISSLAEISSITDRHVDRVEFLSALLEDERSTGKSSGNEPNPVAEFLASELQEAETLGAQARSSIREALQNYFNEAHTVASECFASAVNFLTSAIERAKEVPAALAETLNTTAQPSLVDFRTQLNSRLPHKVVRKKGT